MILVITGNGKGKTTSALGTAIRACGWEKRVAMVFFDKGGSHYGEQNILNLLQGKIDTYRFGLKRFDEEKKEFRFKNTEADKVEVKKGIDKVFTLYKEKHAPSARRGGSKAEGYFLIVCDELVTCLNSGLIDDSSVQKLVNKCPKDTHLLLTGRGAPDWLIGKADLVSDVKEVKHYFKKGDGAINGLDY